MQLLSLVFFIVNIAFVANSLSTDNQSVSYLKTPKKEHIISIHNEVITDYYHWLRDSNWPKHVQNPEILSYLELEKKYTHNYFSKYKKQEQQLLDELKTLRVKKN